MSTYGDRDAVLKLLGIEHPVHVKLRVIDSGGVWVVDKSLALELKKLAKAEGLEIFLGESPSIFFPHSRIEWIMSKTG